MARRASRFSSTQSPNHLITKSKPLVGIVMDSEADRMLMEQAATMLKRFGVSYETQVLSRTRPALARRYARTAASRGMKVLIVGSGGTSPLAQKIALHTTIPVVTVPMTRGVRLSLEQLRNMVQGARGAPMATVAIDNATNAALLSVQCLSLELPRLARALLAYKRQLAAATHQADQSLPRTGRHV